MSKVSPVTRRPGITPRRLAYLDPTAAFSFTLVGVSQHPSGLEVFTVVYDRCCVAHVPVVTGKRAGSYFHYGVVGSEPHRESPIAKIVDYITIARSDNWATPYGD